jgi:endonuclease YncB( thermonuclease family)
MAACLNYNICMNLLQCFNFKKLNTNKLNTNKLNTNKKNMTSNTNTIANIVVPITPYSSPRTSGEMKIHNLNLSDLNNTNSNSSMSMVNTDEWSESTIPFTFPIKSGKVIKVCDGDTFVIASKLPYDLSPLYRVTVRLIGTNAPLINGKNDDERMAAIRSRDALAEKILNKDVRLENIFGETYGRVLADVYVDDDLHINQWMIHKRYALKYSGKTKLIPKSWLKYNEHGIM